MASFFMMHSGFFWSQVSGGILNKLFISNLNILSDSFSNTLEIRELCVPRSLVTRINSFYFQSKLTE